VKLHKRTLVWPRPSPDRKPVTVLELRAGCVQDVLPPSIHPSTGKPYVWVTAPRDGFPVLPDCLLSLWLDWEAFKGRAMRLCSWAPPDEKAAPPPRQERRQPYNGTSVIAAFNAAHDVCSILEVHSYKRDGRKGNRWKSPDGSGAPGLIVLPDGQHVLCFHHSDALGEEGPDGKPRPKDAFDLFTQLAHRGNFADALDAAALAMGMSTARLRQKEREAREAHQRQTHQPTYAATGTPAAAQLPKV
jgi:putative DNA primase/helicase